LSAAPFEQACSGSTAVSRHKHHSQPCLLDKAASRHHSHAGADR